jgi:hypothetical protein
MANSGDLPQGGIDVIVVNSIFLVLAVLAVIARFYARAIQKKSIALDDYFIVAGLVFTIGTIAVGYSLVLDGGAGRHMVDATPEQIQMALKLFVPAPLLWAIATCLVKVSILCFYISIFTMPRIRSAVYVVLTLTVALLAVVILQSFLLCRPFAYTWDKSIEGGVCGSSRKAYLSVAIVNLVIDLAIVFLPMPVLWTLKMTSKKKLAITFILGLGLVICALTAARIESVLALDPLDFTYTMVPDLILGALEVELGIVNACLPILRPLFSRFFGSKSRFASGWTRKSKNDSAHKSGVSSMPHSSVSASRRFQPLGDDDTIPLDQVDDYSGSRQKSGYDVEAHSSQWPMGGVTVTKDIYVRRSDAVPPPMHSAV